MTNWYYVQGSERVGPVTEEFLNQLFQKEDITFETYIWKKGFKNWEKLKDISELHFSKDHAVKKEITKEIRKEVTKEITKEIKTEKKSSELKLSFEWKSILDTDEKFFIKIGADRRVKVESPIFGPYSLIELREALQEKRINDRTLIFAAGMPGWVEIAQTPLGTKNDGMGLHLVKDLPPLLVLVEHESRPFIALVSRPGVKECSLLGLSPSQIGKDVLCSLYSGVELKANNVKMKIEKYNPKQQEVICKIIEMNDSAQKIMQQYVE